MATDSKSGADDGTASSPRGPLSGIRVIDLTHVVLGPLTTMILGDLGADIIKVEPPEGDIFRKTGVARHPGMGAGFLQLNRNKRSIAIDLKRPEGAQILRRLIAPADIFIHSIRARAVERLGFSYDALAAENPRLVYCAAVGFGTGGPYEDRPAYDDIIQGASGLVGAEIELAGHAQFVSSLIADKTVGLTAAYAIMAALFHRERTGRGQAIEVPMFETMVQFTMLEHLNGLMFEPDTGPAGHTRLRGRRPYKTRDGHVCVLAYTDRHWRALFPLLGRAELLADPRYADTTVRLKNMSALYDVVEAGVAGMTTAECLSALASADIPAGKVNRLEDVLADPHVDAVSLVGDVVHPSEGRIRSIRPAVRFSETPAGLQRHAPRLGEHSVEILREAALAESEIADAIESGVVRHHSLRPSA